MPAQLLALNDGPSILVDKPILLLGRHPECDIQIESRKISRRHCVIAQVNDYLVVRDLDSTNGIRINGARVLEGKLLAGDELTIGSHRYQVTWDDAPISPPVVPGMGGRPLEERSEAHQGTFAEPMEMEEDELLEECEEPVALPDPHRPGRPLPGGKGAGAGAENLELLPGNGSGVSGKQGT